MTENPSIAYITQKTVELRKEKKQIRFSELKTNINLAEAYALVNISIANDEKIAAWKLGGTNQKTQDVFKVSEAYYGPIFESEMATVEGLGKFPDLGSLEGEAELALRLTSFGADRKNSESTNPNLIFDQWAVAIEFPYCEFSDIPWSP